MRQLVTFQRATITQSAIGEPTTTWAALASTWARVEGVSGKERFSALQVQADVDFRILCRYQSDLADLAPDDRVIYGSQVFDIKSVINTEGRNIQLEIFAKQHI